MIGILKATDGLEDQEDHGKGFKERRSGKDLLV